MGAAGSRVSISPSPGYSALGRLAAENKVLLVAAAPVVEGRAADPRASLKLPVVRAILRAHLARWCVLGSSLAGQLHGVVKAQSAPLPVRERS